MRFSPEDEHVSLYGRSIHQKSTASTGGQLLLKTWSGNFAYTDEHSPDGAVLLTAPGAMPYPRLPVSKINKAFEDRHWIIESIRISHVQLLGSRTEFLQLASHLTQCHTLKSVLLSDARTSALRREDGSLLLQPLVLSSGFDTLVSALANAPNLQEISLQNMPLSNQALADLCSSTSLIKFQLLLSQSMLQPTGHISGDYIQPMTQRLQTNCMTLKELRIIGVLDYEACHAIADMLQVNTTLQKMSVKIKLIQSTTTTVNSGTVTTTTTTTEDADSRQQLLLDQQPGMMMPLLSALGSSSCSLSSLELYLSGARQDLENYAHAFGKAMRVNRSIQHINLIFYGLETIRRSGGGGGGQNIFSALSGTGNTEIWMNQLESLLVDHHNYTLEQVMINHGLIEMSDKIKLYLKLNRVGRRLLLEEHHDDYDKGQNQDDVAAAAAAVVVDNGDGRDENVPHPPPTTVSSSAVKADMWIETLERVRNDLSCLFYFLSCNPTLFRRGGGDDLYKYDRQFRLLTLQLPPTTDDIAQQKSAEEEEDEHNLPLKRKRLNKA